MAGLLFGREGDGGAVHRSPKAGTRYGFVRAFAPMKADLLKAAKGALGATGDEAVLWFACPKQTSKRYNRDPGWFAMSPDR